MGNKVLINGIFIVAIVLGFAIPVLLIERPQWFSGPGLVGTWESEDAATILQFRDDGNFFAVLPDPADAIRTGTYDYSADTLTLNFDDEFVTVYGAERSYDVMALSDETLTVVFSQEVETVLSKVGGSASSRLNLREGGGGADVDDAGGDESGDE